jgi:hypothetical protein
MTAQSFPASRPVTGRVPAPGLAEGDAAPFVGAAGLFPEDGGLVAGTAPLVAGG